VAQKKGDTFVVNTPMFANWVQIDMGNIKNHTN
jgi:hypothetical protein